MNPLRTEAAWARKKLFLKLKMIKGEEFRWSRDKFEYKYQTIICGKENYSQSNINC